MIWFVLTSSHHTTLSQSQVWGVSPPPYHGSYLANASLDKFILQLYTDRQKTDMWLCDRTLTIFIMNYVKMMQSLSSLARYKTFLKTNYATIFLSSVWNFLSDVRHVHPRHLVNRGWEAGHDVQHLAGDPVSSYRPLTSRHHGDLLGSQQGGTHLPRHLR